MITEPAMITCPHPDSDCLAIIKKIMPYRDYQSIFGVIISVKTNAP